MSNRLTSPSAWVTQTIILFSVTTAARVVFVNAVGGLRKDTLAKALSVFTLPTDHPVD